MKKENCLKIIARLLDYLQENSIVFIFPMINKQMLKLLDKSDFGTVEAEISLDMTNDNFDSQIMFQNWMEVSNHFGNMASYCFDKFGHVALEIKEIGSGMTAIVYFQPEK
ncbi:MAG TPA: hypothetical protein DDY21_04240 [Candidatus Moranbacteria bacterium]|nr:hypothetical protein [Candidatus Moranbacteria bacterium]HCO99732.1 hypothetical protein [Candidatus Moranbacteria bacterium]